jgi:hypothetical protein
MEIMSNIIPIISVIINEVMFIIHPKTLAILLELKNNISIPMINKIPNGLNIHTTNKIKPKSRP